MRKYKSQKMKFFLQFLILFFLTAEIHEVFAQEQKTDDQSQSLKKSAVAQMQAGRFGEAIDLLNKYISANPRQSEGYNLRGVCYENRGQFQNAVLDFRRSISLDQNNAEAKKNLARTQNIWFDQLRNIILGYEREIAIDPSNPFNYLEIGKSYRLMEEWQKAEEWYDKYLERDQNASPDEIIRYTEILAKLNHIKKGETILKKWVDKYPDDWRLWSRYGYFTMWVGNYRNAEKAFKSALGFKPFFKEALDGLDQATKKSYVTQQDPRAFEKEFPIDRYYRMLRNDPKDVNTRFSLVDELIKAERIEEAYQQLIKLGVNNSNDPRYEEKWNYVNNFRSTIYEERIKEYSAKLLKNPKDKVSAQRLAEYYQYLEQYDESQQVLRDYFEQVPNDSDEKLRFFYAKIAAWNRDFELAVVLIDDLLKKSPDNLDYQLFRAQLSIWNNREMELVGPYLENVLAKRPDNLEALISMGSYMLFKQNFDMAQEYADKAAAIDSQNNEVVTLQTNIDFQKLRAEEEKRYKILEEGRRYVLDGDCQNALSYYEQYLSEAEPNNMILKEYGDVLFCAKRYREALSTYDEVLSSSYFYEVALQRGKLLYTMGDSLGSLAAFKQLRKEEPDKLEPYLYMGDSYAKLGDFTSANDIYDTLLTWDLDSTEIVMIKQRQAWIPPTGLSAILQRFPSSIGFAPSMSYYSDNISFKYSRFGGRLDVGVTGFLSLGVSFYKTYVTANRYTLDSVKVDLVDRNTNYLNDFNRNFTSFKGHVFLIFSNQFRMGFSSGSLNSDVVHKDFESEIFASYEIKDTLNITASYMNSDAAIILYSPYLIDYNMNSQRIFASIYKLAAKYYHKKTWVLSGSFQYVTVSDNNAGNDIILRAGKFFEKDLTAGYEYYYANYKYVEDNSPLYYSPEAFESHSVWADFIIEKNKKADISLGGKLGYIPTSDLMQIEGHINGFYKFSNNLQLQGTVSIGSTSRESSSYRYFSAGLAAYWGF
ncbi:MAG: tetratricopeptide repeat protein [Bacteroidetes bacterium]|nr:tetratricopeptide repeat protein [Bacteroidota bacterium]